jgi:hypothetical protein
VIQYGTAFSGIMPFFAIYFYEYLNLFSQKKIMQGRRQKIATKLVDFLIMLNFAGFWPTYVLERPNKLEKIYQFSTHSEIFFKF